jgi:DNA-binding LacI/PurR family transcriptional regulator
VTVHFLDGPERLTFAEPSSAQDHVQKVLGRSVHELESRKTFIFCASDNLALGARVALSAPAYRTLDIRIISFDCSDTSRAILKMGDPHFFGSVDQRYDEYAEQAVSCAAGILDGRSFPSKVTRIAPGWTPAKDI